MHDELCTVIGPYVPKAVVLHRSWRRVRPGARLHVLCVDDAAAGSLERLGLEGVVVWRAGEIEARDPGLAAVRGSRTPEAYGWTAKASFLLAVLDRTGADRVTFLDADQLFLADPAPVLDGELADASIGIISHRLPPQRAGRARWAGIYNCGWVTFRDDDAGREALGWWRDRCVEWCHAWIEPGRYGDQAYLDDWPERFRGVHVIEHPGLSRGPWSDNRSLALQDGRLTIEGRPLLLFHFQSVRVHRRRSGDGYVWRTYRGYGLGESERELLWRPYVRELEWAVADVAAVDPATADGFSPFTLRDAASEWRRDLWIRVHDRR